MWEKIKEKGARIAAVPAVAAAAVTGSALVPALAYADDATVATVTTSMTTALTGFATQALNAISTIIPIVMPIMGAILIVGIGVRVFKKFAK